MKRLRLFPMLIPPLAEQHRIIAKVDELMALCDQLEAAQKERESRRDRLVAASLHRLGQPEESEPPDFRKHVNFHLCHFKKLTTRPEHIKQLRQTILNLAVRGKLVPQDPNDEPASKLLKRIQAEKAKLYKAGGIRKEKPFPPFDNDNIPFHIPEKWVWSRLAEVGIINPRNNAPDKSQAAFISMPLISGDYGVPHTYEVRQWGEIKRGYTHFAEGDVGLAKITPCFENGKSTIFRGLPGGIGAGTTELHIVRPVEICAQYILIFLKCPSFIESGVPKMTGTAGQKRVSTEYFSFSPFPLPPLPEQHRIVAKVDEMMAICDQLEVLLNTTQTESRRLLEAVLQEALNGKSSS